MSAEQTLLAEEKLREGNLDAAMSELKSAIQKDPANAKYRVFLFQIMTVVGKWDSALSQLNLSGELDPGNLAMVQAYREAIRCEGDRQRVFAGEVSPLILGEPDQWLALLIESFKQMASGMFAEANRLRDQAFELAPATSGQIKFSNDREASFEWIADADPRMGPVLEAVLNGQYYWVPMHRIQRIDFEAPADLRDFVWTPVHFTFATGGQTVGMIPTRYFGSEAVADPAIQLARKTDWQSVGNEGLQIGLGQRMLTTDTDDFALLDVRQISLNVEAPVAEETDEQASVEAGASLIAPASIDLTSQVPSATNGG